MLVEDSQEDAELSLWELKREGLDILSDIAQTPQEFRNLVRSKTYDVILSDYSLRSWQALDALQILQEEGKDIPVILVTGSLGDKAAVECVKKGICDYVLKEQLARLPFTIRRAMQQKAERKERDRLEEQLQLAQKMEAVGRLAGGVAHDFNNLLTVITGYSELLLEGLPQGDPMRAQAGQIKKAGDRAASLTRQLLAFSRKQVLAPEVLDLNYVVVNIDKMLQRLIGEDVELATVCYPDLWRVRADPGQIEQVIMNLAVNARDAMPQGGKLTIETANVNLDDRYRSEHPVVISGDYVMLAVSDTGGGMTPEVQSRIFEPFFTTKEQGKGTGLGLATVYGIVKQSGGYIWVYSEPQKGTTFKIYLPRVQAARREPKRKQEVARMKTGSETILLVEDDKDVRKFVRGILEERGYALLVADGGEDALQMVASRSERIHLLLTDVVMPRMNGPDLAARLARFYPEMKVLYMSGYADKAVACHGVLGSGMHFLQKPFNPEDLARCIRKALDG